MRAPVNAGLSTMGTVLGSTTLKRLSTSLVRGCRLSRLRFHISTPMSSAAEPTSANTTAMAITADDDRLALLVSWAARVLWWCDVDVDVDVDVVWCDVDVDVDVEVDVDVM